MFGASIVSQAKTDLINTVMGYDKDAYCSTCSVDLGQAIVKSQNEKYDKVRQEIIALSASIPVITSQAPSNWEYEVLDMVSTQTTSGTGFLTDLSQSINDFFGSGSNTTNRKVSEATEVCKTAIRNQCLKLGGNAIIATDIDFSEVGSGSTNMLMVCMAGTAIRVDDTSQISTTKIQQFQLLSEVSAKFEAISQLNRKINTEFNL